MAEDLINKGCLLNKTNKLIYPNEQILDRKFEKDFIRGLIHEVMWKVSFVGIARGSCGGIYICYLSEITQINPLKFDLPFWRHSSPLRPELPD